MSKRILLTTSGFIALIYLVNYLYLNDFVKDSYYDGNVIIDYFFPRFEIEKHRFPISFFIDKKNQILYRFTFLALVIVAFKRLPKTSTNTIKSLDFNIRMFHLFIGLFVSAWTLDIQKLVSLKFLFSSVKILNLFQLPEPTHFFLIALFSITIGSAFISVFKVNKWVSLISFTGFLLIQSIFSSYQKIDHGFTPLLYLGFTFCLYLFRKTEKVDITRISVLIVSLIYFQAGIEKILISGSELLNPENIIIHFSNHPTIFSKYLLHFPILLEISFLIVVIFQLTFVLVPFIPKLKNYYIISGIIFHLSTYIVLEVGWWISPWSLALLLLIDWSAFLNKTSSTRYNQTGV